MTSLLYSVRETKLLGHLLELFKALGVFTFSFLFALCIKYLKKKKVSVCDIHVCPCILRRIAKTTYILPLKHWLLSMHMLPLR